MSKLPVSKMPGPKPSLSQIATATGSQLDLLAGKGQQVRST